MKIKVTFQEGERLRMFSLAREAYAVWEEQPLISKAKLAPRLWLKAYLTPRVGSFVASLLVALAIRLIVEAVIYWIKNRTDHGTLSASFAEFAHGVYEVES